MLSDEEKKALKELTEIKELVEEDLKYKDYEVAATLDQIDLESLVTVLNLIEKQSKEIEELKKPKYIINFKTNEITKLTNDFVSKDKIKVKIEELKEDIKYSANPLSIDNSKFGIKVLQSLLEKE